METLSLVLGVIIGLVVGFAGTYFTLVTKLQKKLDSTKSKLGRAKSASEDTETLQFQLEAQKGETQALQARLESLESNHRNQLDELQATQAAALAQLTAEKTALEDELNSLRESGPAEGQWPPDQSDEVVALQAQLLAMEQEHQATVQALQNQYQAEIEALQQSSPPVPEPLTEDFAPPAIAEFTETLDAEFEPAAEPVAEFMEATVAEETAPDQEGNWVDDYATAEPEVEPLDQQEQPEEPMAEEEGFSPFDAPPTETTDTEAEADLENWVDAPAEADSFESFDGDQVEASLPDMDFGEGEQNLGPMDLETELPDISEEGITDPEQQSAELFGGETLEAAATEQSDDQFLAELSGEESTPELPLFTETPAETLGELEDFGEDLSFTPDSGDDLNLSEDLLASLDTGSPTPELNTEEILPGEGGAEVDDLDFLLELQTEDAELFPGQNEDEFLPEFSNEEPISAGFASMEILAEGSGDFPDLLEANPETHGGDPFVNVLDEDPNSSDNDLLALLQIDESSADQAKLHQGDDDDLFPGLADMLGEDPSSGSGELDDLDALLGDTSSSGGDAGTSVSLDDFDFGSSDHDP
ncbi:hypothetical protein [Synechocystis salina]|uniref:Uncharacterized protein n=1 Tax=Synechocystis salina LEGE 00031 TaxID=1828736 RepID=A0ABR9VSK8_9SYNC|nr:hypothetical protein [Synechocystis salina]MBE9240735.1 hypothetical protein [Synechocystis salina LEGE 00041]MBE9254345.1 hypothetical protein [Synechocystis salina LEGE 00031]